MAYGTCSSGGGAVREAIESAGHTHRYRMLMLSSVMVFGLSMLAMVLYIAALPEVYRSNVLIAAPPKSEHHIVAAAESATEDYASADVTTASIKAKQAAKAQYEKMIATALKEEAKAHQEGEKATKQALMQDSLIERRKMATRIARARRDRQVQSEEDAKMSQAIRTEVKRTLVSRVEKGV